MRIPGDKSWDIWEEDVTARTDFSKTIRKIRNYWPYSILCAVILVVLALLYLYKTNPVYNVTTSILIQDNDQKGGSSGGFISSLQDVGLLRASDNVHDEQMIITSYPLVENVVNDLQLFLRFSIKENIKNISLYKTSLPFKVDVVDFSLRNTKNTDTESISYKVEWDNNKGYTISSGDQIFKGLWNVPLQTSFGKIVFRKNNLTKEWPGDKVITMTVYPVSEVTDQIISDLNASIPNKQTNIINLSLHTATPALGVDVLNALIASYQSATVNDNNKLNDSTLQFINQRLLIVGRELDSIEMGIQQFKQQNQLTNLPKQSDVLVDNLSKQDQALNSQLVQLSMINSLIGYLDDNKDNPRVIPASLVINDNSLSQTIENYNRLLSARERLELSATNENPIFRNIEDQLAGLQKSIRTSLETARLTLSTGIGKMKQQSSSLTGMMRDVPAIEREFGNFNRQQTIKRDLYLFLLQKREESLLAKSSTIANSKIIGPARASKKPIKPKRELIILSSVLAGLLIPFGYEWLVSLFNNKIRTKDDIKNLTELPIVGEIGFKKEDGMVTTNNARNLTAEQFRALRTNIQFLLNQEDNKVILVSSMASGEGKTFVSSNLASIFGLTDKKIVLMEMDLRRPRIMQSLGLKAKKGFTQYAIGKAEIDEIIIPSKINNNVFVIPSGTIPPNPSELILHKRTNELFGYLRKRFDLIIIDSAPSIVSDPHLLAKFADISLYIVRINHTLKEQLKQINNPNIAGKLSRLNLVINGIKPKQYGGGYYSTDYYDHTYFIPEREKNVSMN